MSRVLVACEFSGIVRDAFTALGHEAWSCDFLPTERSGPHIVGDVLEILDQGWDLMIAHPPCTYLAHSGARWMYLNGDKAQGISYGRMRSMREAAHFFLQILYAPIPHICVENPLMHHWAQEVLPYKLADTVQGIQPYMFGHPDQKLTHLWLKNLPPLEETEFVTEFVSAMPKRTGESRNHRAKDRSRTYPGVAKAMAEQWTAYLKEKELKDEH